MRTMRQIFARRVGRIAFGVVLLIGVAAVTTTAWSGSVGPHRLPQLGAARIIAMTWLAAMVAGVAARAIAVRLPWSCSSEALFAESLMVPTAGIALLLPITLHMPLVLLIADAPAFDVWVMASLWITGLAHLVFATLSALRARQLVAGKPALTPRKIYVVTVITSCVPFVVLYAIPPALVALTALPFVPMLHAMERVVGRDRAELEAVAGNLPRAIARAPQHAA
jgi:hypothetical protein